MPTTRVKWANISGKVYKIESVDGLIDVNLADVQELFVMNTLVCKMSKGYANVAAKLRKDDIITVWGKILGVPGISNVVVQPCKILG